MTTGAEHGEIAEVGTPVAVDPDPVDRVRPWRWATVTIATATLFLALTNAHAVQGWFDERPPGSITEPLRAPIHAWSTLTGRLGLDAPRAMLRQRWQAAETMRFGKEQPGEAGAGQP
jgi:hypothetical protein